MQQQIKNKVDRKIKKQRLPNEKNITQLIENNESSIERLITDKINDNLDVIIDRIIDNRLSKMIKEKIDKITNDKFSKINEIITQKQE